MSHYLYSPLILDDFGDLLRARLEAHRDNLEHESGIMQNNVQVRYRDTLIWRCWDLTWQFLTSIRA